MSPDEAAELQEFILSRLTVFPDAEVSVAAKPGGATVKVKLGTGEDDFEIKDDEFEIQDDDLELFQLRFAVL